jgi:hypothetical protein
VFGNARQREIDFAWIRTTMAGMRGDDQQTDSMFSHISAERRVPQDHPLRAIRLLMDDILRELSRDSIGCTRRSVGRRSRLNGYDGGLIRSANRRFAIRGLPITDQG